MFSSFWGLHEQFSSFSSLELVATRRHCLRIDRFGAHDPG
jgi:hypothetical protein